MDKDAAQDTRADETLRTVQQNHTDLSNAHRRLDDKLTAHNENLTTSLQQQNDRLSHAHDA